MSSNSDDIVQQVQQDFQALATDVTGAGTRVQHAYMADLSMCMEAVGKPMIRPECGLRIAAREHAGEHLDVT